MAAVAVTLIGGVAAAIALVGIAKRVAARQPNATGNLRLAVLSRDLFKSPAGLTGPDGVCAAAMDWHVGSGVATLVVSYDGSVSLYQSTGGGIIGAGQHETIRGRGLQFLSLIRTLAPALHPTGEYPLPTSGQVAFWLVYQDKTLRSDATSIAELVASDHPFHAAMGAAQATITALREQQGA